MTQTGDGPAGAYGLYLHEIATGRSLKRWPLEGGPAFFGFTPNSRTLFVAAKQDDTALGWTIGTGATTAIPFPEIAKKHFFSRDFTKFAYLDGLDSLQLAYVAGLRSIGKINPNTPRLEFQAAAFSTDNRFVLIGAETTAKRVGKGMLVDLNGGKTVAATGPLDGIPDQVDLAANGLGLLQGPGLKPRLYRFPTGPDAAFVKLQAPPPPPTPGFTQLFNGKDLTGWKLPAKPPGNWHVENGILIGSTNAKIGGRLYTDRPQPRDFHLRIEARISDQGAGGVLFRCQDGTLIGYQAPINSTTLSVVKTGSLYALVPGRNIDLVRESPEPPVPARRMVHAGDHRPGDAPDRQGERPSHGRRRR